MLAYRVTEENLPLITTHNAGVEPKIENGVQYFITDSHVQQFVSELAFNQQFEIRKPINAIEGRYAVRYRTH